MKKLLALVLALVMTLSLATVGANAAFEDEKISEDYAEAVAVLNGMGVFQGDDNGKFNPTKSITRAEVATILYRIATADTAKHGSNKAGLYASYNKFSDGNHWAAGYIGYCANAELVKGYPDGTFQPEGSVTGYEVLAMILRAVGYDKNNEFSGADWALNVAKVAQQLGMLKNVDKNTNLGAAATRELVAELLFRGIQSPVVTYTPAFGYVTDKFLDGEQTTIAKENFNLDTKSYDDNWGRPGTNWYNAKSGKSYVVIMDEALASYNVATTQCDICEDLGEGKSAEIVKAYNNGKADKSLEESYKATATKALVGAQGQQVEIYAEGNGYRLVVVDTYLAQVASVKDAKLDSKGHVKSEAELELDVFGHEDITLVGAAGENFDYVAGDYVLVYVNEEDVQNSEIVEVVTASSVKYSGISYKEDELKLDGEWVKFACKYAEDEDALNEFATIKVFYDLFGNVIGTFNVDVDKTTVVIDALYTEVVKGKTTLYADLVGTDGESDSFVVDTIEFGGYEYDASYFSQRNDDNYDDYEEAYDKLFTYTVNEDDSVNLAAIEDSTIGEDAITNITAKDRYVYADMVAYDAEKNEYVEVERVKFTDDTIFLVHENDGSYTSTTGADMEDIYAAHVEVVMSGSYAKIVYLFGGIYRSSDVNEVYVPLQDATRVVEQKVDGTKVLCLKVTVVPTEGEAYTAYLPLDLLGQRQRVTIEDILDLGDELSDYDVQVGGFFLNALFVKDTTIFSFGSQLTDDYSVQMIKAVKSNTVTLDNEDISAFNLAKVENIYVIENGEISEGSASDVKANTLAHIFWAADSSYYVADKLYVDLDLTAYVDEYTEEMTELLADYSAAKKADDNAKTELTKAQNVWGNAVSEAADVGSVAENEQAVRIAEMKVANAEEKVALGEEGAEEALAAANKELAAAKEALEAAKAAEAALTEAVAKKAAAEKAAEKTAEALDAAEAAVEEYAYNNLLLNPYVWDYLPEVL